VRRRKLGALSEGAQTDDSGAAAGKRYQMVVNDDLFDLVPTHFVKGQDGLADELLLLQLADDVAIVSPGAL
jgi:hypothetical protein